ncbi:hypothetical protein BDV59DRAFT_100506 [Aspergillus ambiguus]|uniref:uncharacterized protein n=1 Tax=Aspergillus ambiguus TaxID=176160 RepID=UPI003CCDAC6C
MGKSKRIIKNSQTPPKPKKRRQSIDWDDWKDKHMLLNVFHLLNVGKSNFRELSEVMGKDEYSEHELRKRFGKLTASLEEIKKYRVKWTPRFVRDDDSDSEDADFENEHPGFQVVVKEHHKNNQPSPLSETSTVSSNSDSGYGPASDPISPTPRRCRRGREPSSESERHPVESKPGDEFRYLHWDRYRPLPPNTPKEPVAWRQKQRIKGYETTRGTGHNYNVTTSFELNTLKRDDRRVQSRRG